MSANLKIICDTKDVPKNWVGSRYNPAFVHFSDCIACPPLPSSYVVKMGIVATTGELFDQREYNYNAESNAKPVRRFYTYYSSGASEPIGFSKTATVYLWNVDVCDSGNNHFNQPCDEPNDNSRLSASTVGNGLWRCGNVNSNNNGADFIANYEIVFYYRT